MQSSWRAPQTRDTAAALAVSGSGKQNHRHAKSTPVGWSRTLMPNPSLKRTPNGIAFWPRTGCRAHFPVRGQNAMPLGVRLSEGLGISVLDEPISVLFAWR